MKIREIMSQDIQVISKHQTVQEAAKLMRDHDVGMLPVYEESRIVGTITDRDICINAVANGDNPLQSKVESAMNGRIFTCFVDDDIEQAADLMKDKQIRRVLIIDEEQKPVGMLSLGDIASRLGTEQNQMSQRVLVEVSEPRANH